VIRPQLEEWADVAAYEPDLARRPSHASEQGLAEWDEQGWDTCFVAGDGLGAPAAVEIVAQRRNRVQGLVLGHAALSQRRHGDRAPISEAVWSAMTEMLRTDRDSFIRNALVQLTGGSYDEDLVQRMQTRYPRERLEEEWLALTRSDVDLGETLMELDLPLLLGKHEGCLLHTDEGYEDAVAAFPEARTVVTEGACSTDPAFGEAMRAFCETVLGSG
jgi:hypothetical protein